MQIIQKIRDKGAAIVIIIIALSLIGFILMDANLGANRMSAGGASKIGEINGVSVDTKEYQDKIQQIEDQYGGRVSGPQLNMLRQTAWDQLVAEKVMEAEFEKLGLSFSPKELSNIMFSDDAPQTLKQAFTDKNTGEYDIQKVQQWWQSAKKSKGEQRDAIERQIVEPIRLQTLYSKYSGLLAAAGYYPSWMKERDNADTKAFANISYVAVPYNVISDSAVNVSDNDITDYVSKHKSLFKQEAGRQVAYVSFSTNPSAADTAKAFESISVLKNNFAVDTNAQAFVARNMSSKNYEDAYILKSKLTGPEKDTLASLAVNAVYGPYLEGKNFVLAKKIAVKQLPDSIKCRHILIATNNPQTGEPIMADSIAKKRIDSIELAIKAGASFDELEAKYSSDEAAHKDKGVMTFDISTIQNKQQFAPEFGEFLMNESGETKKTVKTNFGWHYIEILEKKNFEPAYKMAYLAKEISASDETVNAASAKASKLSAEARNAKAFDDYVAKNGLQKMSGQGLVKENDYNIGNLQDARQVVKWAFGAKEGDVSEPFNVGADQYIVAVLTKIQPEGLPDAKTARPMVELTVRTQKKAEQIKTKLGATPSLESAAAAYNQQVATAGADSSLTFASMIINGVGQEPKLIGAAFNKAYQSKVSEPIAGNNGVYVVKVNSIGNKPATDAAEEEKQASERAKSLAQQMGYGWFDALKNLASVKDKRSNIY